MKGNASEREAGSSVSSRRYRYTKVHDNRKHPVRGLWRRNGRFFARIAIEDDVQATILQTAAAKHAKRGTVDGKAGYRVRLNVLFFPFALREGTLQGKSRTSQKDQGNKRTRSKDSLRFAVPPYYVGMATEHFSLVGVPGDAFYDLSTGFAMTAGEARNCLINLRRTLRWSRPMLAAVLGVSVHVLRRWETGERGPNGAARRLIWLLNRLTGNKETLVTVLDTIFWDHTEDVKNVLKALPASDL